MLLDAAHAYPQVDVPAARGAERSLIVNGPKHPRPLYPTGWPTETHETATVEAFVNEGRWIVRCPCGGAELADRDDRRFFCLDCRNEWAGGLWVKVEWPRQTKTIEEVLELRPDRRNRHWRPGESVPDLRAENRKHGVKDKT